MTIVKKIKIGGAEYKLLSKPRYNPDKRLYEVTIERANGDAEKAYASTENGQYRFKPGAEDAEQEGKPMGKITFTLCRHGATELNAEGSGAPDRIRGWLNPPLAPKGAEDAAKLGARLKSSGITHIYHSDLVRAEQTAQAISDETGAPMTAIYDLRPWNVGVYTGQESKTAVPELHDHAIKNPDDPIKGGESFNQFKTRAFAAFRTLLEAANVKGQKIALVTHHRLERLIKAWVAGGCQPDGSVDFGVMFSKGERPGTAEKLTIDLDKMNQIEI